MANDHDIQRVEITGLDIPFSDLLFFLLKLTLAAIPAIILLTFVCGAVYTILAGRLPI